MVQSSFLMLSFILRITLECVYTLCSPFESFLVLFSPFLVLFQSFFSPFIVLFQSFVSPFLVLFSCFQSLLVLFSPFQSFLVLFSPFQSFSVLFSPFQSFYSSLQSFFSPFQPFLVLFSPFQSFLVLFGHFQYFLVTLKFINTRNHRLCVNVYRVLLRIACGNPSNVEKGSPQNFQMFFKINHFSVLRFVFVSSISREAKPFSIQIL